MIELASVSKNYGRLKAVDHLNIHIKKGEFYALLGPNGAGKTTTVRMLCGLTKADQGDILIKGMNINENAARIKSIIGIVPQEIALYDDFTARENLRFWGSLYGVKGQQSGNIIAETLKLTGLSSRADDKVKHFSGGMKRRINIAASLLHQPEILIMDEPTVGIDPQSRIFIYEMLQQLVSNGLTIVYTTHYMDEVEKMCSRVGIIDQGKIIAEGNVDELRTQCGCQKALIFKLNRPAKPELGLKLKKHGWSCVLSENSLRIQAENTQSIIPQVLRLLDESGLQTESIEFEQAGLELVFLTLTGKQLRE